LAKQSKSQQADKDARRVKGEARELILAAAEELFAQHGVEAVSLRAINAAAGVSPGVLHYHFGSREALVERLIRRHMTALSEQRRVRLNALADTPAPALEQIAAIMVEPLAELALNNGGDGRRYTRFIARLYADRSPVLETVNRDFSDVYSQYSPLLQRALPDHTPQQLEWRLAMANHAMLQTLADLTRQDRHWLSGQAGNAAREQVVIMLTDFICCGIRGSEVVQQGSAAV
jgi:AcrR family transcriptional regulator